MHDRIVHGGVKWAVFRGSSSTQAFSKSRKLGHRHFHAFFEGLVSAFVFERTLKIVIYGKESGYGVGLRVGIDAFLFLQAALRKLSYSAARRR
jgi:hypothetical protein